MQEKKEENKWSVYEQFYDPHSRRIVERLKSFRPQDFSLAFYLPPPLSFRSSRSFPISLLDFRLHSIYHQLRETSISDLNYDLICSFRTRGISTRRHQGLTECSMINGTREKISVTIVFRLDTLSHQHLISHSIMKNNVPNAETTRSTRFRYAVPAVIL